jgi:hypothetical protein
LLPGYQPGLSTGARVRGSPGRLRAFPRIVIGLPASTTRYCQELRIAFVGALMRSPRQALRTRCSVVRAEASLGRLSLCPCLHVTARPPSPRLSRKTPRVTPHDGTALSPDRSPAPSCRVAISGGSRRQPASSGATSRNANRVTGWPRATPPRRAPSSARRNAPAWTWFTSRCAGGTAAGSPRLCIRWRDRVTGSPARSCVGLGGSRAPRTAPRRPGTLSRSCCRRVPAGWGRRSKTVLCAKPKKDGTFNTSGTQEISRATMSRGRRTRIHSGRPAVVCVHARRSIAGRDGAFQLPVNPRVALATLQPRTPVPRVPRSRRCRYDPRGRRLGRAGTVERIPIGSSRQPSAGTVTRKRLIGPRSSRARESRGERGRAFLGEALQAVRPVGVHLVMGCRAVNEGGDSDRLATLGE